jgi:hypothetical protein
MCNLITANNFREKIASTACQVLRNWGKIMKLSRIEIQLKRSELLLKLALDNKGKHHHQKRKKFKDKKYFLQYFQVGEVVAYQQKNTNLSRNISLCCTCATQHKVNEN